MNYINEETNTVQYVIKVNGVQVLSPTTRELAEQYKLKMPPDTQKLAEIVPVTAEGKQILFG